MLQRSSPLKSKIAILVGCTFLALLWIQTAAASGDHLLRMPGATLLLGFGYVDDLVATTPTQAVRVLPADNQPQTRSYPSPTFPSISRDGKLIACARLKSSSPQRVAIATYSIEKRSWVEYAEVDDVWALAISPDNRKLAYVSNDVVGDSPLLHVLDMDSKLTNIFPAQISVPSAISWSPDSDRITYQTDQSPHDPNRFEPLINVADVKSGQTRVIGAGKYPSWSRSGEWITYIDQLGQQAKLVHSDGSGERTLATPPHNLWGVRGQFLFPPVWSPDSTQLLLNEVWDVETLQTDVLLFNAATGKLEKKYGSRMAVLGWAEAR